MLKKVEDTKGVNQRRTGILSMAIRKRRTGILSMAIRKRTESQTMIHKYYIENKRLSNTSPVPLQTEHRKGKPFLIH
jgi:hypothetical protein